MTDFEKSVETYKSIDRMLFPNTSEEELDARARQLATNSMTINEISDALESADIPSVQMHSCTYRGDFCIHFTHVNTAKKYNKLTFMMDNFTDKVELVKETKTTLTFALKGMRR